MLGKHFRKKWSRINFKSLGLVRTRKSYTRDSPSIERTVSIEQQKFFLTSTLKVQFFSLIVLLLHSIEAE
jgi:hypothetical protein